MLSVCFVLFVYRCELAILESAQLGSSGAARTCTLATVSVTVTTISNFSLNDEQHQHSEA